MMSTSTDKTEEQVLAIARKYIDTNQPPDYRLVIQGAEKREGDWYVFIDSEPREVSGMDFARRLAEIEGMIEDETGEQIWLHTALWRDDD